MISIDNHKYMNQYEASSYIFYILNQDRKSLLELRKIVHNISSLIPVEENTDRLNRYQCTRLINKYINWYADTLLLYTSC